MRQQLGLPEAIKRRDGDDREGGGDPDQVLGSVQTTLIFLFIKEISEILKFPLKGISEIPSKIPP